MGQVTHALLTRPPLSSTSLGPKSSFHQFSLDLHVLGTPPAFILSQDQTLNLKFWLIMLLTCFFGLFRNPLSLFYPLIAQRMNRVWLLSFKLFNFQGSIFRRINCDSLIIVSSALSFVNIDFAFFQSVSRHFDATVRRLDYLTTGCILSQPQNANYFIKEL